MRTMNLNSIEARQNSAFGRFNKAVNDMIDIKLTHLFRQWVGFPGHRIKLFGSNTARSDRAFGRIDLRPSHAATVEHLHNRDAAMVTNVLDNRTPGVDLFLGDHP